MTTEPETNARNYFAASILAPNICPMCRGWGSRPARSKKLKHYAKQAESEGRDFDEFIFSRRGGCEDCESSGLIRTLAPLSHSAMDESADMHRTFSISQVSAEDRRPIIAIAGGGIGGSALALALQARGMRVLVFEKDRRFTERSQGYGLTMQQGANSLKQLGISVPGITSTSHFSFRVDGTILGCYGRDISMASNQDAHRTARDDAASTIERTFDDNKLDANLNGTQPKSPETEEEQKSHTNRFNVHITRQALRGQLLSHIQSGTVIWGVKVTDFELLSEEPINFDLKALEVTADGLGPRLKPSVRLYLSNGETLNVHLLVGADGIFSTVRRRLIQDYASQKFLSTSAIGTTSDLPTEVDMQEVGNTAQNSPNASDTTSPTSNNSTTSSRCGVKRPIPPQETVVTTTSTTTTTASDISENNLPPASPALSLIQTPGQRECDPRFGLRYLNLIVILGIAPCIHPVLSRRICQTLDGDTRIYSMPFTGPRDSSGGFIHELSAKVIEDTPQDSQLYSLRKEHFPDFSNDPRFLMAKDEGAVEYIGRFAGESTGEIVGETTMWQLSYVCTEEEALRIGGNGPLLLEEALKRCEKWHFPIPQLLACTPASLVSGYPVYDRDPLDPEFLRGVPNTSTTTPQPDFHVPVVLLGDSAHPMSPFKGQGANQALVDALHLARTLYDSPLGWPWVREMHRLSGKHEKNGENVEEQTGPAETQNVIEDTSDFGAIAETSQPVDVVEELEIGGSEGGTPEDIAARRKERREREKQRKLELARMKQEKHALLKLSGEMETRPWIRKSPVPPPLPSQPPSLADSLHRYNKYMTSRSEEKILGSREAARVLHSPEGLVEANCTRASAPGVRCGKKQAPQDFTQDSDIHKQAKAKVLKYTLRSDAVVA